MKRTTKKQTLALLTALLLAPLAALHADNKPAPIPTNPLPTAKAVWRMTGDEAAATQAFALKAEGPVKFEPLSPEEAAESRKRGGADNAATLTPESILSLEPEKSMQLRPAGDAITLYTRVHFESNAESTAFYSDFLTLAVHRSGLAIAYLGVKTPNGRVYRELPLAMIDRGGWLDLVLRVVANRQVEFFCNGQLKCTIPLGQSLAPLFKKNQSMTIGAMREWSNKPLLGGKFKRQVGIMKTATVALWDRALSDGEIAFLSGVTQLAAAGKKTPFDQALLDFNAFFDASLAKDVAACGKLSRSLMEFAARDPERPIYHLTQPLGWIFDPAGAFFYEGRYHVFSYRQIYSFLRYNSLDHYVSDDLVRWTQWPIGPWADSPDDQFGIWLNNHFLDDDGVPTAIYCAFDGIKPHDHGILARSRDGMVSFSEKQLILPKFHDGHIWKEGDTWFNLFCYSSPGERPADLGSGFSIFTSSDLKNWTNRGEIFARRKTERNPTGFGEFPYLISFGDKDVFISGSSPSLYWVGRLDRQNFKFIPDHAEGIEFGLGVFNPLTVDNKGPGGSPRRIIMAMHQRANGQGEGLLPWNGVHTMPRTLEFDGRHLRQEPLPEFESLRGERETQRDVTIKAGTTGHIRTRGDAVEIDAEFEPGDAKRFGLKLRVSDDGARFVRVWFDTATGDFGMDGPIQYAGSGPSHLAKGQPVRMRVFVDKVIIETFVNGQTHTAIAMVKDGKSLTYFPVEKTYIDSTTMKTRLGDGLDLFSEGGTARCTKLDVWKMNRAEPK